MNLNVSEHEAYNKAASLLSWISGCTKFGQPSEFANKMCKMLRSGVRDRKWFDTFLSDCAGAIRSCESLRTVKDDPKDITELEFCHSAFRYAEEYIKYAKSISYCEEPPKFESAVDCAIVNLVVAIDTLIDEYVFHSSHKFKCTKASCYLHDIGNQVKFLRKLQEKSKRDDLLATVDAIMHMCGLLRTSAIDTKTLIESTQPHNTVEIEESRLLYKCVVMIDHIKDSLSYLREHHWERK